MATQTTTSKTVSGVSAASIAQIRKLFEAAKDIYAPGGGYMGGIEAQLARTEKRAVASGMQGLAAAGLAGTSMAGGLGKKFQEEVAVPALAQAESTRLSALAGLYQSQAGAEAQMAPRYTTQYGYRTQETSQWGIPKRPTVPTGTTSTAAPRVAAQPTAAPKAAAAKPTAPAPTVARRPDLPDPAGTLQATIGGISYYSDGRGGFTQTGTSTTKKQPAKLTSFYSGLTPSAYQPKDVYKQYTGLTPDSSGYQPKDVYRRYGE